MDSIRPDRVLFVINSDNAQSSNDATNYANARGLTGNHQLGFAFGTNGGGLTLDSLRLSGGPVCTTAPYVGQLFCTAIADYLVVHGIDAVILSTFTPYKVFGDSFHPPYNGVIFTLSSLAGYATHFAESTFIPAFYFDPMYSGLKHDTIDSIYRNVAQNWRPGSVRNPLAAIPHGRLGCPEYDNAFLSEIPLRGGAQSIAANSLQQGLLGETVDHTGGGHLVSDNLIPAINKLAADWARQLAMFRVFNLGNGYDLTLPAGGNLSGNLALFAVCEGTSANFDAWVYGGPLADSFTVEPGGWCYQYTSYAGRLGTDFLYNGGAAAVFTYGEPLATGIPSPQELFIHLTRYQMPLMLAHFLAVGNGMGSTPCGDPMYAPYKSTDVVAPKPYLIPFN